MDSSIKVDDKLQWIGENKLGWGIIRSKYLFRNKSSKNHIGEELLSVNQKEGVIKRSELDSKVWNPSEDISSYKLVEYGNFVISLRSFEGGLELSKIKGLVSPAYTVLENIQKINNDYFWWMMKSSQFIIELNKHVSGIRQGKNIGWDDFSNIYLLKPPYEEQKIISKYLDKKTAKIDLLIEKIKTKIELLKEQKTALIDEYVTKGLDPNVEMKEVGIDFIGKIPQKWKLVKLKYVSHIIDGDRSDNYPNENDLKDSGILFLSSKNIIQNQLNLENKKYISKEKFLQLRSGKLEKEDLIITVRGTIGNSCLFNNSNYSTGFINAQMMILRSNLELIEPYFLFLISLSSYWKKQLDINSYGTAQKQLSNVILSNSYIIIPSFKEEQKEIVRNLSKKIEEMDNLKKLLNLKIQLLYEYRQSLISSVVTGKIQIKEDM